MIHRYQTNLLRSRFRLPEQREEQWEVGRGEGKEEVEGEEAWMEAVTMEGVVRRRRFVHS